MKKLILLLTIIIINSCRHNIPIAKINFNKIEKDKKADGYFDLYFSSDKELINSLKGYAYIQLDCFFKDKRIDKKDYKILTNYTLSSVGELQLISEKKSFNYIGNLFLKNNNINIGTEEVREKTKHKISELINKNDDCLSCVITAVAYMNTKERYISETMCLPNAEIKKILK